MGTHQEVSAMYFFKRVMFWAALAALIYFAMNYHYIYFGGGNIRMLKKSKWTLEYTFYSAQSKRLDSIMRIDSLREDGIGDILVEEGKMDENTKERLLKKYGGGKSD
jgi:hypothetical protein